MPKPIARCRRKTGVMNGTEAKMAAFLEAKKQVGEVLWYAFEQYTLKLANDTRYTPDFAVMLADGTLEFWEVKGFWRDDAKVKIKVAAAMFPHRFLGCRLIPNKRGGDWEFEVFE